jgi:hypothetical protein
MSIRVYLLPLSDDAWLLVTCHDGMPTTVGVLPKNDDGTLPADAMALTTREVIEIIRWSADRGYLARFVEV